MRIVSLVTAFALCLTGFHLSGYMAAEAESREIASDTLSGTYLMARTAALHHHLEAASQLFRQSLDRDPENRALLSSAYYYAAAAGDMQPSFRLARRLLKVDKSQHVAHLSLAVAAMRRRAYAQAVAEIKASAGSGDLSYAAQLFEAWAYVGMQDRAAAEKLLDALAKQPGTEMTVAFNRALIADYCGDEAAAVAAYDRLRDYAQSSPRIADAYGRYLERHNRGGEAKALYQKIRSRMAFRPVARAGLARIADQRIPDRFVSRPAEGAAEALLGVASALHQPEQADISLLFLRLTKHLRPDFLLADMLMAARYEASGRLEPAVAIYRGMAEGAPYYALARMQCADDLLSMGQEKAALSMLRDLIRYDQSDVDIWLAYGDTLRQVKAYDDAVYAYSRAIALLGTPQKRDWTIYFSRANAAEAAGKWDAAEADLNVALQLSPNQPDILNFLGYSWVEQHKHLHKAMHMLEKASRQAPGNGFITDSVGWAYFRLGQYGKAVDRLEQAVKLQPGDATINDHLGDAYWMVGRTREARFQWNHALAFGAAGAEKAKIEQKLKNGLNG